MTTVIPAYNKAKFIVDALNSLASQLRPPDRVLVIDDCSTDNTCAVVRNYDKIPCDLIVNKRNLEAYSNSIFYAPITCSNLHSSAIQSPFWRETQHSPPPGDGDSMSLDVDRTITNEWRAMKYMAEMMAATKKLILFPHFWAGRTALWLYSFWKQPHFLHLAGNRSSI